MTKEKLLIVSNTALFVITAINSVTYMMYDFLNNDVRQATSFYGTIQLAIAVLLAFLLSLNTKFKRNYLLYGLYFLFTSFMIIQIVPAFFWFLFNGKIVNDKSYDGITGNWLFGAYHIGIIVWCLIIIMNYKKN